MNIQSMKSPRTGKAEFDTLVSLYYHLKDALSATNIENTTPIIESTRRELEERIRIIKTELTK